MHTKKMRKKELTHHCLLSAQANFEAKKKRIKCPLEFERDDERMGVQCVSRLVVMLFHNINSMTKLINRNESRYTIKTEKCESAPWQRRKR